MQHIDGLLEIHHIHIFSIQYFHIVRSLPGRYTLTVLMSW